MNGMTLEVEEKDRGAVIYMGGRVMYENDSHTFRDKLDHLLDAGKKWFVLDLSQVVAMSSTGLGILIAAHRSVRDSGGTFKLAQLSEKVRAILEITRLNTVFDISGSVDDAVKGVKKKK